ncbi:MAG: TolC family protein [Pseudomonadota bacterium]
MFRKRFIKILMLPAVLAVFLLIAQAAIARQSWHIRQKSKVEASAREETTQVETSATTETLEESTEKKPPDFKDEFTMELLGGAQGHGVLKLTLEDCINRALERNMQLRAADKDIEAARGQLIEAKAQFWPVLEYKYRMAPVPTDVDDAFNKFFEGQVTFFNSIHVGIGVPLVTFGQLHMAKKLAQGGVEAATIRSKQAEGDVIYQVKQIYYGIQFAKETIKLLEEAVEKINNKLKSNGESEEEEKKKELDEEGEEDPLGLDPYDKLQLKAFKLELERQLERANENIELAYDGMRIQLDLEPGTEILLDSTQLKPKLASLDREEQFVDGGMLHQHEVKLLDIGVETKRRQYKLEKYKLLPRAGFGFFVDVGRTTGAVQGLQLTDDFNDPFNFTRAGVGLEVKGTIDFHGAYGRLKKAAAEYHKAAYERMIARRALTLDIRKAYLDAKQARQDVARTKKEWSVANQMMFLSKVNLDIGVGDRERYTDSLKYVLLSRGRYFKAVFDYNMALASLEKRIGRERYDEYIPTPDIDELEAFEYGTDGEEEEGGWITLDEEDDSYGRETENGGTTGGFGE